MDLVCLRSFEVILGENGTIRKFVRKSINVDDFFQHLITFSLATLTSGKFMFSWWRCCVDL